MERHVSVFFYFMYKCFALRVSRILLMMTVIGKDKKKCKQQFAHCSVILLHNSFEIQPKHKLSIKYFPL